MTIDNLAVMVQRGFAETATKKEVEEITKRLDGMDSRLDRIEFHMNTHERRLEILEDKMRMVGTKLGLRR